MSVACASRACAARSCIVLRKTPGSTWCAPAVPSIRWKSLTTISIGRSSGADERVGVRGRRGRAIEVGQEQRVHVAVGILADDQIEVAVARDELERDEL